MRKGISLLLAAALTLMLLTGCSAPVYEVRYELNGGTLVSGELLQRVEGGGDAVDPTAQREGYIFTGWDKSAAGVQENMVLVAQWERQYQITFDPQGGTVSSGEAEQQLSAGETPKAPKVTMENYTFEGWSPEVTAVEGDATYTAQWKRVELNAEQVYERVKNGVGEIMVYDESGEAEALGTGFFIDDHGTMATNYHVIQGAYSAEVTMYNGAKYDVEGVIDYDAAVDIALIHVNVTDNEYLNLSTREVRTGEKIFALGSPRGQTGTFTDGIVSIRSNVINDVDYIQFTAPISPGNSGGPLLNTSAEVIGINSMSMMESQNMNYAININALSALDRTKHTSMKNFYQTTNEDYLWVERAKSFVSKAAYMEEESNDAYLQADPLSKGKWTAAVLSSDSDVDWFYFELTSAKRFTFEIAPNQTNEAKELFAAAFVYRNGDLEVLGMLEESNAYTYKTEKVYTVEVEEPGYYFLAVTHDNGYTFGNPYVYLVRAN